MWIKRLTGIIAIPFFLFSLIAIFPVSLDIGYLIRDRDVLINYKKYEKKYILIDSIVFSDLNGSNASRVDGYSKELNNYKTTILFGSIKDDNYTDELGMKDDGDAYKYVWYRDHINKAYPGEEKDKIFPVRKKLYSLISIPLAWLFSVFISYLLYKFAEKRGMFNTKMKNEK